MSILSLQPMSVVETWPPQVNMILSALSVRRPNSLESRRGLRREYRVSCRLSLFADGSAATPRALYTRDVDTFGAGFVTSHLLALGYGGTLEIIAPDGQARRIVCTIHRCREVSPGWFEGALRFNREQSCFGADAI